MVLNTVPIGTQCAFCVFVHDYMHVCIITSAGKQNLFKKILYLPI